MQRSVKMSVMTAAGVVALGASALASGPSDAPASVRSADGKTVVTAPETRVDVDHDRGKVRVIAPYTNVKVDPDARVVKIRVPYFNGDIRW